MTTRSDFGTAPRMLVLGGAGFIGQAVCRLARSRGFEVTAADANVPDGMDAVTLDISSNEDVVRVIGETAPDYVVNLAFKIGDASDKDLRGGFETNVLGSQNVLDACYRAGVRRYVYASSIAIYGSQEDWGPDAVLTEQHPIRPGRPYGWHKDIQEGMARSYRRLHGMSTVGLRISSVYGPGRERGISAAASKLTDGRSTEVEMPWTPDEAMEIIHVDDVAEAFVGLCEAPEVPDEVYNSGGETWTVEELVAAVQEVRPELVVTYSPTPVHMPHTWRHDWSNLQTLLGLERPTVIDRVRDAAESAHAGGAKA